MQARNRNFQSNQTQISGGATLPSLSSPSFGEPRSGPLTKIKHEIIQPIKEELIVPANKTIVEEYLYVKEISPNEIYDMRIPETKFRELLKKQKLVKNPNVQIVDQYSFFQFTISHIQENSITKKEIYVDTMTEPPVYDSAKHRYKMTKSRVYHSPMELDVDVHRDYHLIVRLYRFTIGEYVFEIIVPSTSSDFFDTNLYQQLISEQSIEFPSGTHFVIKKT